MFFFLKILKKKKKGQTTVEYMFLLGVIVFIAISIMTLIKDRFIGDLDQCMRGGQGKSLICQLQRFYALQDFKYFNLPVPKSWKSRNQ